MPPRRLDRLRDFVGDIAALLPRAAGEADLLEQGGALLKALVAEDDWLPDAFAVPDPKRYRQYLLHCDTTERFSVVSFVWGPGQATPVHNHTVWGLVGVLRGAELSQGYGVTDGAFGPIGEPHRLEAGDVEAVSPTVGDIHRVSNAYADRASVSIHVYGANIGAVRRATFAEDGTSKTFISGYNNTVIPNLWDRSASAA